MYVNYSWETGPCLFSAASCTPVHCDTFFTPQIVNTHKQVTFEPGLGEKNCYWNITINNLLTYTDCTQA